MNKYIFFIIFLFFFTSITCCRVSLQTDRQDYSGTNLRMDGIFYNKPHKAHFFLYRNGFFYNGGAGLNGQLIDLLDFYKDSENYKNCYILSYCWGVFKIENNEILIEIWVSGDAFERYTTTKFGGVIINETTLLLNHPVETIGTDTFCFHKFSP